MPYVALYAHKMLGQVAAVKLAVDLLTDPTTVGRGEVAELARQNLDDLELTLKALITAPRESLDEDPSGRPPG